MMSTKLARSKPGTKRSRTSALTLPKVVSGLGAIPSVKAWRMRRLKSGRPEEPGPQMPGYRTHKQGENRARWREILLASPPHDRTCFRTPSAGAPGGRQHVVADGRHPGLVGGALGEHHDGEVL